jgi:hypothetical protein
MTHVYTVSTDAEDKSHGKFKRSATLRQISESPVPAAVDPKQHHREVAEAAYFRAEHRGFLPGYELEDWLDAEAALK